MPKLQLQLIANPVAGRQEAGDWIERVQGRLRRAGAEVSLCLTGGRGDAERFAAQGQGFDRIVAAGGDGTVNEVVNGMRPDSPPLVVLPLGTTNVLAIETRLPRNLDAACDLAVNGVPRPIHLGLAGERRFVLMAGIGFDAAVVRDVDLDLKRRWGKAAYLLSALQGWLRSDGGRLRVEEEDGRVREGYGLIAGKARCYGGRFSLTPGASLFRDDLEVCLIRRPGRLALVLAGLALLSGRPLAAPWGEHFRSRGLRVSGAGLPVQIDGDPAGYLPCRLGINPFPIRMMLPPDVR